MIGRRPPDPMHRAGLSLDGLPGVEEIGDWQYHPRLAKWSLRVTLRHNFPPTSDIPSLIRWHFVVDSSYPLGNVSVCPDKHDGIQTTFPHQLLNSPGDEDLPWNNGNLCASTRLRTFGRGALTKEPWHPSQRLKWYVVRSLLWLNAAATGTLTVESDHFELPDFGVASRGGVYVAFQEDAETFADWGTIEVASGLVELIEVEYADDVVLVRQFQDLRGTPLVTPSWPSRLIDVTPEAFVGGWIRLPDVPVLAPYQVPQTWGKLAQVAANQGIDLWGLLRPLATRLRTGRDFALLIGYPIKNRLCDPWSQIQWQAIHVPALAMGNQALAGFRRGREESRWHLDKRTSFGQTSPIEWRQTRNWSPDAITARGRFEPELSTMKVLIVGAGALGSSVAEMLVRGGVQRIGVVDDDILEIGNLVRHTLTLASHRKDKSSQLVKRLNRMTPNVQAVSYAHRFGLDNAGDFEDYDLIIDSTGEDEVLHALDLVDWLTPKRTISISVGLGAKRLYFYTIGSSSFSAQRFEDIAKPLFDADRVAWGEKDLPEEEIGCWSPIFPARYDDITLLASAAVKELTRLMLDDVHSERFVTFEQQWVNGDFTGLIRVEHDCGP
jgi:molybdopterin/thiamine biosynthesis adenylyltransferase